jgi:uracil-DNA glycosylase
MERVMLPNANAKYAPIIGTGWAERLSKYLDLRDLEGIMQQVDAECERGKVYPCEEDIFRALHLTSFEQVKIVILGQDPYHGPGQAHGLAFSVPAGVAFPPSLRNIFKELKRDLGIEAPLFGDLSGWARQGVLLLNTSLTVRAGEAGSHQGMGWERFTDAVVKTLDLERQGLVFLLWGNHAQAKADLIDPGRHSVLTAPHPSPLSAHRGFIGCGHFSKANELLVQHGKTPIDWGAL